MLSDFTVYPALADLPPLVRKQRRLEAQIVALAPLVEDEKAVRKAIDALLLTAGLSKGDGVTCLGYDVTHIERVGTSRLDQDTLVAKLVAQGLSEYVVRGVIEQSTEVGDPSAWATVKPSKGSKVRVS